MVNLSHIQIKQEEEYIIPYHYLITDDKLLSFPLKLITCPHYISYLKIIKADLAPFRGQKILDIGCGDGRFCYELKNENAVVYGVDRSERAIAFASTINPQANFQIGDVTKRLPFKDAFADQIILIETLEHIQPNLISNAIKEVHRVLKYKGELIITVPHFNRKLDSKHYQHFKPEHLRSILSHLFSIVSLYGYHKNSLLPNLILQCLTALYYYVYPLKILGIDYLPKKISQIGYLFFNRYLKDCGTNEGFTLICKATKDTAFSK